MTDDRISELNRAIGTINRKATRISARAYLVQFTYRAGDEIRTRYILIGTQITNVSQRPRMTITLVGFVLITVKKCLTALNGIIPTKSRTFYRPVGKILESYFF